MGDAVSDATAVQAMQRHLSECEVARRALVDRALKLETALWSTVHGAESVSLWMERDGKVAATQLQRMIDESRAVLAEVSP